MNDNKKKLFEAGEALGVWPMRDDAMAFQILEEHGISHLEKMRESYIEFNPGKSGYALARGKWVNVDGLYDAIDRASTIKQVIEEGTDPDDSRKWMTDWLLDWTIEYLYNIHEHKNVRVFPVSIYNTLIKKHTAFKKLSKNLQRPTAMSADRIAEIPDSVNPDIQRKIQGARALCTLEVANVVAKMSKTTGGMALPVMNDEDKVYSAVICKLTRNHFSFVVIDAERAQYVHRPVLVYFDSMGSTVTPEEDSTLISLSNIARMESAPIHTELAKDQKTDSWTCGYRAIIRLKQVVTWLANNRQFDDAKNALRNETPIKNSKALFLVSIAEKKCESAIDDIHKKTIVALLYLIFHEEKRRSSSAAEVS